MPVIAAGIISFMIGIFCGLIMGYPHDAAIYKKCRHYDQTIERCVTELGWEKK